MIRVRVYLADLAIPRPRGGNFELNATSWGKAWDWGVELPVDRNLGTAGKVGAGEQTVGQSATEERRGRGLCCWVSGRTAQGDGDTGRCNPIQIRTPTPGRMPEADNAPAMKTLPAAWRARPDRNDGKLKRLRRWPGRPTGREFGGSA